MKRKSEKNSEPGQKAASAQRVTSSTSDSAASSAGQQTNPLINLQRTIGNQAVRRLLNTHAEETSSDTSAPDSAASNSSSLPERSQSLVEPHTKPPIQVDEASALRDRVSQVTGTDVRSVPVENSDLRDASALTHKARVTLGPNATKHDVAHELAHAAQQRSSSGPSLGAGEAERRADAVASAALSGQSASLAPGRVPSAAVLRAGDPYSREAITLAAPPAGLTIQDLKDQLNLKIKAGDITGYSISGIKPGDPEEKFLYNALVLLADKGRWGSELDLITSIGAGKGEVTVRFDASGKAEAQLVGKSEPNVPVAFAKVKDARDALIAKYKLKGVKGENRRSWSIDELNKVLAAWGRLSAVEAAALEGYTLIRTDKLTLGTEPLQGQTTHTDEVSPGETKAKHVREIRFADSAFGDDDKSFIGDAADAAPASFEVLIHEVGHAIEGKPFDDLNAPATDDAAKANKAKNDAHAAQLATNTAISAALVKKFPKTDLATGQPLFDAISAAQKVLQEFEKTPDATNEAAATKAIADRDAVKAKIPKGNKVVAALAPALTAQNAYLAALKKFLAATAAAAASSAKADALKSGSNTTHLQSFIDFVTKERIPPPTAYAAKHWPSEPAEFFDEAFSLWKNDPVFFAKYSPKLKAWFDAGNHLK